MDRRLIVAGSREFDDYEKLKKDLDEYVKNHKEDTITIVSGNAIGADRLGEQYAKENNLNLEVMPANWFVEGRSAGVLRNKRMLEYAKEGDVAELYAFWNGESKGTANMIKIARNAGCDVYIEQFQ